MHKINKLLFTAALCVISAYSFAQPENIEELTVTGEQSLRSLKNQMDFVQDSLYEDFNEIYEGTDYEIHCANERAPNVVSIGVANLWETRICATNFLHEQRAEAWEAILDDTETISTIEREELIIAHSNELKKRFSDLIAQDPNFRDKAASFNSLKQNYTEAYEKEEAENTGFWSNLLRPLD